MSLTKVLNDYKSLHKQNPEIINLMGDFELRLCSVWSSRLVHKEDPKANPKPPKNFPNNLKWDWLMSHYTIFFDRWLQLAGFPVDESFVRMAQRVVDLQMVYPDGTLHDWIARTLKTKALSHYKRMHKTLETKKPKKGDNQGNDEADAA